jgi:hypothetical protein
LRATRPDDDPDGFLKLRAAYEAALKQATSNLGEAGSPIATGSSGSADVGADGVALRKDDARLLRSGIWTIHMSVTTDAGAQVTPPPWGVAGTASDQTTLSGPTPSALRGALGALGSGLRPDANSSEAHLQKLLQRVLDLITQSTVTLRSETEDELAELLIYSLPRSDALIEESVHRLRWQERIIDSEVSPQVLSVLTHGRDAVWLNALKSGQHHLAQAFLHLSKPMPPLQRWWRAHASLTRRWPELELLRQLQDRQPHLLKELDKSEVAWWRGFAEGPKLLGVELWLTYACVLPLTVIYMLAGIVVHGPLYYILAALLVPPAWTLLLLVRLYLLEWPSYLVGRRHTRLPLPILAGWLPLLIATFTVQVLPHRPALPNWWASAAGAFACLWAIYVSNPMPQPARPDAPDRAASPDGYALCVLLGVWWLRSLADLRSLSHGVSHAPHIGALCFLSAVLVGRRVLVEAWNRLSGSLRGAFTLILCLWGIWIMIELAMRSEAEWQPLNLWMVLTFVVTHRFALDSRWGPRVFILIVCAVAVVISMLAISSSAPQTSLLRIGGLGLIAAALCNLFVMHLRVARPSADVSRG